MNKLSKLNNSKTENTYRRLVIQPDPIIGYRFIPNLYSRINRPKNQFVIQTNAQGFRDNHSFEDLDKTKPTVLVLGDSYVAGDGLSNHERFTNLISNGLDVHIMNMGLPGSGTDQQLLIQERIASQFHYDVLVVVPFLHNLNRNMVSHMPMVDWATRTPVDVCKPYFCLNDEYELVLNNFPVPLAENFYLNNQSNETITSNIKKKLRRNLPILHTGLHWMRNQYNKWGYVFDFKKADVEYADPDSYGWCLMRAILKRMLTNAKERPVLIIPIPVPPHIVSNAYPNYLDRFNELAGDNVKVIDILPALKAVPKAEKHKLFIPDDGHFSAFAHSIIARTCQSVFQQVLESVNKKLNARTSIQTESAKESKYILGISCFYHDSAAAIIRNGNVIAAAQEERFTRVKHDKSFPINAINYCLEEAQIETTDLSAVVYYDNENLTLERMIAAQLYVGKSDKNQLKNTLRHWIPTKFSIWTHIRRGFNYSGPCFRTLHHRSHAASAFYPSPFDEAAIVTVDGVGEWSTTTIGFGEANKIQILKEQHFPHSLGLLYSAFTSFCGFKVNSGEYKLMGLAPYGKPRYREQILQHLIELKDDGSFKLNLEYFGFLEGKRMTNDRFAELFDGPARESETQISQRECDLASSIQSVVEEGMIRITRHAWKLTGKDSLVMAGGVALNCVANGKILREGPFKKIWIQPASGDAGGALGSALDVWYGKWNNLRKPGITDQQDSCFGPAFSDAEIESFLKFHDYKFTKLSDENRAATIANYLLDGKVVGHFCGRMEYGPRALGARSILADPREVEMQKILNLKIKYRESFRPFAPIVMEERIKDYFAIDSSSPYMLLVASINDQTKLNVADVESNDILMRLKKKRSTIPAVTHLDYSARIQSVSRERYPQLYDILKAFEEKTGCAVLVNTSFNVRGEPIVCTPGDAYKCFMRTEMDVLIMNNFILQKQDQPKWQETKDWRSNYVLD